MKDCSPIPCTKEAKHWKKQVERNWYCCVEGCEKIRNGASEYCINHQAKKKYEKSDPFIKKLLRMIGR